MIPRRDAEKRYQLQKASDIMRKSRKISVSPLVSFAILTLIAIYDIVRSANAFHMSSIKRRGVPSLSSKRKRLHRSSKSSPSSLYVLSSPRRRTNPCNNTNINISPPIQQLKTNLTVNNIHEKTNGNGMDSQIRASRSSPFHLSPSVSSATSNSGSPPATEISHCHTTAGAASKSSLFRRNYSSSRKDRPHYNGNGDNEFYFSSLKTNSAAIRTQQKENKIRKPLTLDRKGKQPPSPRSSSVTEVTTIEELNQYWPRCLEDGEEYSIEEEECMLSEDANTDPGRSLDYNKLLREISVRGDTQIIGSKDRPDFVHPVVRLMHERKRKNEQEQINRDKIATETQSADAKKEKMALVVEGGGMRGCVSAGMVCAIHCLGLSDTIDVVYGSSAGAVIAAYFVSKQLPYFGPEVYYDSLTTMDNRVGTNGEREEATAVSGQTNDHEQSEECTKPQPKHIVDRYDNDYFIDTKRMIRSMGLGLFDPRLLKDVWTRRVHGKPMMNLHYMFQNIMLKKKPIDYETFMKRQAVQPLKVVATGLSSEKPFVMSYQDGHFDTVEDLCSSLHASCLLPGIAGPVMNVLKTIRRRNTNKVAATTQKMPQGHGGINSKRNQKEKPNFVLRNTHRNEHQNDDDYEPLGDAMLSAPIPYDIAHKEGATHVLVIRSSPDGTNLMAAPSIMAWIGSMIFKRYFLKKNHLPGMYKRSQTEQRHQRVYAKAILELNEKANFPPPHDSEEQQTMTIALEPGSEEVSHLETTREGIFKGVRQGFARAYDALVEDPAMRGRGEEMALLYFPDEILDYDPNDTRLSSSAKENSSGFQSAFEAYLSATGVMPKTWREGGHNGHTLHSAAKK